jgi:hypothetical protein
MKILYTLFLALSISFQLSAQTITTTVIKKPSELRCNEVPAKLNNVVFGAVPLNTQNKPVVVYIHGWFDNGFAWFMAKNKWYENSYNAGYRTAFFFQSVSGAFEDNGKVVAEMIRATCRHYNTDKVIAVCHSKGGFDVEWALYNENVWDSVQGVITLSTPYWGAPMSDLIAVPFFKTILEAIPIVGPIFQGKGTYQMQTAYMAGVVRPMMDNHPDNRPEKFHCYGAWGSDHKTVLPNAIPDDILKVVFRDYQPLCLDIPGFGVFAGDLMSSFMGITGLLTNIAAVQPRYQNPQKNHQLNDGLAPYYSSIRPGSMVISEPPPSQQSYLNHIDVLLSSYAWNIVQPEIEYFNNNPVLRKRNPTNIIQVPAFESKPVASDVQFFQTNTLKINTATKNAVYLVGEYNDEVLTVTDGNNQIVRKINLNIKTQGMYDIFHEVDLSFLPSDQQYTLSSTKQLTGLLKDGIQASIQLDTHADKEFYAGELLPIEITLNNWTEDISTVSIKGYLNRNMDANGNVVTDKLVPIEFKYDEQTQTYKSITRQDLPDGIYNVSVFANGKDVQRFAATSILMHQQKNKLSTSGNSLVVFPNPATDIITIQLNETINEPCSIEIFDIPGKLVLKKDWNGTAGMHQLQLSTKSYNLSKGTYLISLSVNGARKNSKVFVIQ